MSQILGAMPTPVPVDWTAIFIAKLRSMRCDIPIRVVAQDDLPHNPGATPTLVEHDLVATTLSAGPKRVRTIEILVQYWYCKIRIFRIEELVNVTVTEDGDNLNVRVYHADTDASLEEALHVWSMLGISNKVDGMVDDFFLAPTPVEGSTI
jgi:hypothetical protein